MTEDEPSRCLHRRIEADAWSFVNIEPTKRGLLGETARTSRGRSALGFWSKKDR